MDLKKIITEVVEHSGGEENISSVVLSPFYFYIMTLNSYQTKEVTLLFHCTLLHS